MAGDELMASLDGMLRDLVRDWQQVFGDQNSPDLTRYAYRECARQLTALLDQHLAEVDELVEQVNQASDKIEAEVAAADLVEDQRRRLIEGLAKADPYTMPASTNQVMVGALAFLIANAPTKQQLAEMVGAFADEIEKQETPRPGVCPTCGHINILGVTPQVESMSGLSFARREPPPAPTWTSLTDTLDAVRASAVSITDLEKAEAYRRATARCAICGHRHTGLCATDCTECPQCESRYTTKDATRTVLRCGLRGRHHYSLHTSHINIAGPCWSDEEADPVEVDFALPTPKPIGGDDPIPTLPDEPRIPTEE